MSQLLSQGIVRGIQRRQALGSGAVLNDLSTQQAYKVRILCAPGLASLAALAMQLLQIAMQPWTWSCDWQPAQMLTSGRLPYKPNE